MIWPSRSPPPPRRRRGPGAVARDHDRRGRAAALLLLLARVDLADRGRELVAAERLDEELACAGEHRPPEVVRLALDRHHHDRGVGDLGGQPLRGRDAVHVRHVDVHQDDLGHQLGRELECLRPGRGRTDHLDVALEPEELRQVIAGLRDVVHDEDTDLVGHRGKSSTCSFEWWMELRALDGRGTRRSIAPVALLGVGPRSRPLEGATDHWAGRIASTSSGRRTP